MCGSDFNRRIMNRFTVILATTLILAACEEFGPVFTIGQTAPQPDRIWTEEDFAAEFAECSPAGIQDIKDMYNGGPVTITDDVYIKGKVTTSDKAGNFYRGLYIQDDTGGIELKVGKTGLYNIYKLGQTLYVKCKGLTVGEYNGAKQLGYFDTSGEYQTAYVDIQILIDSHIFKGEHGDPVEPLDMSSLPADDQLYITNEKGKLVINKKYLGRYVTFKGLSYKKRAFCFGYVNPNHNHDISANRIILGDSDKNAWGITTWALSKNRFEECLLAGNFDKCFISGRGYLEKIKDEVVPNAYSVSHYFIMNENGGKTLAIRSSGYAKFTDTRLPDAIYPENQGAKMDVTGILSVYKDELQFAVIDISAFRKADGSRWYDDDGNLMN